MIGVATRDRVIAVATRHFAEHGFGGTSLRSIQREAGVNPATVHYYFGTKEALYQAVIEQFLEVIQAERSARIDRVPDDVTGRARLRLLLHAYLAPHLEVAAAPGGHDYARVLAFVQVSPPDAATAMFDASVAPVRRRFADSLAGLFPRASRRRIDELITMAVGHMAMTPIYLGSGRDARRMARAIEDAVSYTAAGFEALGGPLAD